MSRIFLASFIVCAALAGGASADPVADFSTTLSRYQERTEHLAYYLSEGIDLERFPLRGCHAALDQARAAGIRITSAQVAVCTAFVARHQLAEADAVLTTAHDWFFFHEQVGLADNNEAYGPKMAKDAARCASEIDRLVAAGMLLDVEITIGKADPRPLKMRDARSKICDRLAKAAISFSRDVRAAKDQRLADAAQPYKAVGIKGDRLELLVDHASYAMYGVGGRELTTPAQLKKASVIFELLGPGTQGLYTLRRYQFRGDKLVATTSGDFIVRPSAKHYR